jgi:peptidoglycan/LPS O-acetylase OafA/YrhL
MKNNPDKIIHFKNLDGLRAVAAFAVVFYHISLWIKYPDAKFYDILKFILAFEKIPTIYIFLNIIIWI